MSEQPDENTVITVDVRRTHIDEGDPSSTVNWAMAKALRDAGLGNVWVEIHGLSMGGRDYLLGSELAQWQREAMDGVAMTPIRIKLDPQESRAEFVEYLWVDIASVDGFARWLKGQWWHTGAGAGPAFWKGVLAMITVQEKIDVLKMARDLIHEPDAWVKRSHAQDDRGEEIAPEEPDAVCFCLEGAIIRALTELGESAENSELLEMDAELMGDDGEYMTMWQDRAERTHDEVLARVDATLERLEREAIASFGRVRADEEVPQQFPQEKEEKWTNNQMETR